MRRINFILLTAILVVVLMVVQVIIVKNASEYEPKFGVIYSKMDIPEKTEIKVHMLEEKKVSLSMIHKNSFRSIEDIIGGKAKRDIVAGEMILSPHIGIADEMEDIKVYNLDNRLFTVEFKADQANGWWLKVDQSVDIIFVPNRRHENEANTVATQGDNTQNLQAIHGYQDFSYRNIVRLSNIRIAALIDEKGHLLKNTERTTMPKFISFEVTKKQDEFLAYAKSSGRLEISVIPTE